MKSSLPGRWTLAGIAAAIGVATAACTLTPTGLLYQPNADPGAAAAPAVQAAPTTVLRPAASGTSTPSETGSGTRGYGTASRAKTAVVQRGSLAETLVLDGLVAAQGQTTVTFPGHGKVADVAVKAGQQVSQGDELLSIDATDLNRALSTAVARYQTSQANLAQAQAQALAQQQTAAQRAAASAQAQAQAVADAQSALRHAQANLATVQAGASSASRQVAQNGVTQAQANLQKAQDAQAALMNGPDPTLVQAADRDVANARLAVQQAQASLATLQAGPDQLTVAAAERDVQRAQTNLQVAQSAKIDPKAPDPNAAKLQHDSAIADAQLAVQQAQDRLSKLKQPPAATELAAAQQKVADAQFVLDQANAKLAALQDGPDQSAQDAAQAAVDQAQHSVDIALANQKDVLSHPTPSELADAQDQVRQAQANIARAQAGTPGQQDDPGGVDIGALQKAVEQDGLDVQNLQAQLDAAMLKAPFDGVVVSVRARPGDEVSSTTVVAVLAKAGPPSISVQLDDAQAKRVAVGQSATIAVDTSDGSAATLSGTVSAVTSQKSTGPSATLKVDWGAGPQPPFGSPVNVTLTLQEKPDVLMLPKSAVRQATKGAYVELLEGTMRRMVPVQVGISGTDNVEVLGGVAEGQQVLLGN